MVDDCASPEEQKKFTSGMILLKKLCKTKWDRAFENCTTQQRNELVTDNRKETRIFPKTVINFYRTIKRYTLQSFASSKEFMTDIRKYKLVPGANL